ncbi:alginate lyase family protein [bacterium]|nr:alginate lyase family protein [bacterium]
MDKKKLCWYIYRLSKMSLGEIAWRIDCAVNQPDLRKMPAVSLELAKKQLSEELSPLGFRIRNEFKVAPAGEKKLVEKAEKILRHEFDLFGESVKLEGPISWLKDPLNGAETPRKDFLEINYRDLKSEASVMRVWFLNRHYHLVTLAQAYAASGREEFAEEIVTELNDWQKECHYPYGLPWTTSMEAAMRLLVWTFVYRFLAQAPPKCLNERFALYFFTAVKQHYAYVKFNRSRYSSANNHALAELAALLCARETWPLLFEEEKDDLAKELAEEAALQFSESGVNLEQAISYHAFSLELLCAAASQSRELLPKVSGLLGKAADVLNRARTLMPLCGDYGDSDEATASGILSRSEDYYGEVVKLACTLADPSPREEAVLQDDFQWYTGARSEPAPAAALLDLSKECGLFWKGRTEEGLQVDLFFKTGPLGFGKLAAHGHADTLSFLMSVNGTPVFIDSGTGAYHQNRKWREYFRSTAAHNALEANAQSQSMSLGPFMWRENYRTEIEDSTMTEEGFSFSARHYGYKKRFMLTHRRMLELDAKKGVMQMKDVLLGCDNVHVKQYFHVSPLCEASQTGNKTFLIKGPDFKLELSFMDVMSARLTAGDEKKPLGFAASHLGKWSPCQVIVTDSNCIGQDELISLFKITPL